MTEGHLSGIGKLERGRLQLWDVDLRISGHVAPPRVGPVLGQPLNENLTFNPKSRIFRLILDGGEQVTLTVLDKQGDWVAQTLGLRDVDL